MLNLDICEKTTAQDATVLIICYLLIFFDSSGSPALGRASKN